MFDGHSILVIGIPILGTVGIAFVGALLSIAGGLVWLIRRWRKAENERLLEARLVFLSGAFMAGVALIGTAALAIWVY